MKKNLISLIELAFMLIMCLVLMVFSDAGAAFIFNKLFEFPYPIGIIIFNLFLIGGIIMILAFESAENNNTREDE